ncbi:uncharacterized protein A4U43_C07F1450 [Asparagus officinalis]|uniref:Uncharacterized protein n=1 Tax=Asparagus officinalis TaxID=4686 RepID=A0A5P1E8Q6_ASPOF|nr:uncharacterized protein A4U43_C07F1450 [Asparagus officinalis]
MSSREVKKKKAMTGSSSGRSGIRTLADLNRYRRGLATLEEKIKRRSDVDNSEDERRRRNWSLKKKALDASNKLTQSLKKRGKRKLDIRTSSVLIEDLRNAGESEVHAFRQELIVRDLLPDKHDDYHMLLR